MKKISFTFLKSKLFLAGLVSGVIITALAAILIASSFYPPVGSNNAKGTLTPTVGQTGIAQSTGSTCGRVWVDVLFGDPQGENVVIRCHAPVYYTTGTTMTIESINSGEFCEGGGIWVNNGTQPPEQI